MSRAAPKTSHGPETTKPLNGIGQLRFVLPVLTALGISLLAVWGCRKPSGKKPQTKTNAQSNSSRPAAMQYLIATLIKGPLDPTAYRCRQDSDCGVTCRVDGRCCKEPCAPCHQAYRKDFIAKLGKHIDNNCRGAHCPYAKCAKPRFETRAVCRQKRCTLQRRKR